MDASQKRDEEELKEGVDYTLDEQGRMVFTSAYLLKRGYCCQNGCRHCPYPKESEPKSSPKSPR